MESVAYRSAVELENQLHALLDDERDRGEQHRHNYQLLKTDHNRLKKDHRKLHHAMQELSANLHRSQEASQQALQNAQAALHNKQKKLVDFREKVEAAYNQDEIESPDSSGIIPKVRHVQRLQELESECHTLRHEASRLRHLHKMMIAQSQFDLLKTKRRAKEMHTRHAIQLQTAQEVNKTLSEDSLNISSREEDLRTLERENISLKSKVRSLMIEQESLRSSTEESVSKSEAALKDHLRANTLQVSYLRDIESEKKYLKLQKEAFMEEVVSCRKDYLALKTQCMGLQKELSHAKNLLTNSEYERGVLTEQLSALFSEKLGHATSEKEAIQSELNSVRLEFKLSQEAFTKQVAMFKEMESKWERKVESALQEQLDLQRKYQDERASFQKELQASQTKNERMEVKYKSIIGSLEEALKTLETEKMRELAENESLRKRIQKYESDIEREQQLHLQLEKKYTDLETHSQQIQSELVTQAAQLHSQTEENRQHLHKLSSLMQQNTKHQQTIKDLKAKKKSSQKSAVNEGELRKVQDNLQKLQKKHHLFHSILSSVPD